ncbi:MAG: beta-lactamase family protein, partial [Candidatus Eremiobacteraeota bacterium]|nr:beta-lactamase family protein [Candidatus Eremiobacteraeota bacterium]
AQDRSKADTFSGAILIARGSEVIFTNAYGLADRNFQIANQVNTRFDTGSIAKSFTQVAIAQLVEQGKVRLDDTIGKYVPEYPNTPARDKVTIGELLDMTSGVGDIFGERLDQTPVGRIRTLSDYLPLFESEPLAFEPGSKHAYSNGGYILLGIIIEKVTGQSYYDYVHEHIFRPAGMKNTDFPLSDMPHDNEATGYTRMTGDSHAPTSVPGSVKTNVLVMPARGCSAGSARTTVQDLFLYTRALTTETLLKKSTADQLGISGSAMGIGGGGPGVHAGIETGIHSAGPGVYTVVVMSNYDPPAAVDLMRDVSRMLRTAQ